MKNKKTTTGVSHRYCDYKTFTKLAYFEELTVQWEDGVEEAFEIKCFKYNLKNEAKKRCKMADNFYKYLTCFSTKHMVNFMN